MSGKVIRGCDIHLGWDKGARIQRGTVTYKLLDSGAYYSDDNCGLWSFRAVSLTPGFYPPGRKTYLTPMIGDRVL